ncbi:MAG: hypothetical protein WCR72_12870 [Bacteroidota bacterium]
MGFLSISIDNFIKKHLEINPSENKNDLKNQLEKSLADYNKGIKCHCGNEIWVVGSAFAGNGCFTCITGESFPIEDYEIESAIIKKENNKKGRKSINKINPKTMSGFFNDDGTEINIDLVKKPNLCISCMNDNDPDEEILCILTRSDQEENKEFVCYAYKKRKN